MPNRKAGPATRKEQVMGRSASKALPSRCLMNLIT